MWVYIKDGSVWCEPLTDKQRHDRNCIYVGTTGGYDIYVLHEKYYCSKETD